MATQDYSPHLKRVLRSYQSAAMTSLHGPGPNSYLGDTGIATAVNKKLTDFDEAIPRRSTEIYREVSFKKALLYEDSLKNKVEELRRCVAEEVECRALPPPPPPPSSSPPTAQHHEKDSGEVVGAGGVGSSPGLPPSETSPVHSATAEGRGCGKGAAGAEGGCGSWPEPGVFLAPAPFPPQPWPVLAVADKGSPGCGRGCEETMLDGEPIACFSVGGEKRLCLPQILNTVLREFMLWQINPVCDDLRIFCSRSTPSQLDALRVAGVLPHSATSCGLITHTDAQRLTQALLYAHPARAPTRAPSAPGVQVRVYHTCFGKCKGVAWDELYTSPSAPCIECEECHGLFTPARFVCHAHKSLENQTIHWGFEADNWRVYLRLAKDQRLPLDKAEVQLNAFKNKHDPAASHKRKQDGVEVKEEELPKKVRAEEAPPVNSASPNYAAYDPVVLSYMWRQYATMGPAWTSTPLLTKDGKTLPPPPPAFIRDSVPAPVPAYLSQDPPVLVDPGRVVPLSDSLKFERHYQPNIALAPPKVRDKAVRDALKDLPHPSNTRDKVEPFEPLRQQLDRVIEVDCIKRECSPASPVCVQQSTPQQTTPPASTPPQPRLSPGHQNHNNNHQPPHARKTRSPDVSVRHPKLERHPELELSTTDSDTDSVGSVNTHSEHVDEVQALMRGWNDPPARDKVAQLVADLVAQMAARDRQNAALRQRIDAQARDHNHTVTALRNQLLSMAATRHTKEESGVREVCAVRGDVHAFNSEVRPRPPPSVIGPIKTEPCDITDTC